MVMDETKGRGIDVIIFACSQVEISEQFLKMLAPGGRISLFSGNVSGSCDFRLDSNLIHYNEMFITGAYGCTASQNTEAVELISAGRFPLRELITHRVGLLNVDEGLEHTYSKKGLKSIIEVKNE
jgi:L-iditol 2-dehydrogenase